MTKELTKSGSTELQDAVERFIFTVKDRFTPADMELFKQVSLLYGLHPIKKEIYPLKINGEFNIIIGYGYYVRLAHTTVDNKGIICWDGCEITSVVDESGKPYSSTCKIWLKGSSRPTTKTVYNSEYNKNQFLWKTKPIMMLEKVAFVTCARFTFPDMSGLPYVSEEMGVHTNGDIIVDLNEVEEIPQEVLDHIEKIRAFDDRQEAIDWYKTHEKLLVKYFEHIKDALATDKVIAPIEVQEG